MSPEFPSWDAQAILDACERALKVRNAALDQEQSPQGLDALDEVAFHPLLAERLLESGWGVLREQPMPGSAVADTAMKLPKHSQRVRCDLVLLPSPRHVLLDWVRESRVRAQWHGSLFESLPSPPPVPARELCVPASDAYWLEVKVVAQHAFIDGVPRPNGAWGTQLVGSLTQDLRKLSAQGEAASSDQHALGLPHAAVLLVLFAASVDVIAHDLPIALHRSLDKGARFRSPIAATRNDASLPAGFAISDRIGNAWCQCVLVQTDR